MSYIPRSSLIPKEASGVIPMQMKKRRTIHIFGSIAMVLFFGSVFSSGGVFLYNDYLRKNLASAQEELDKVSDVNNEEKIKELQKYDEKLNIGNTLLDNHLSASIIFSKIEAITKETVQFDSFDFVYDPGFDAILSLSGSTEEFSSVALQEIQFLEDTLFSEFAVRGITASNGSVDTDAEEAPDTNIEKQKVSFSIDGKIKKGLLNYTGDIPKKRSVTQEETSSSTKVVPVIPPSQKATTTATTTNKDTLSL